MFNCNNSNYIDCGNNSNLIILNNSNTATPVSNVKINSALDSEIYIINETPKNICIRAVPRPDSAESIIFYIITAGISAIIDAVEGKKDIIKNPNAKFHFRDVTNYSSITISSCNDNKDFEFQIIRKYNNSLVAVTNDKTFNLDELFGSGSNRKYTDIIIKPANYFGVNNQINGVFIINYNDKTITVEPNSYIELVENPLLPTLVITTEVTTFNIEISITDLKEIKYLGTSSYFDSTGIDSLTIDLKDYFNKNKFVLNITTNSPLFTITNSTNHFINYRYRATVPINISPGKSSRVYINKNIQKITIAAIGNNPFIVRTYSFSNLIHLFKSSLIIDNLVFLSKVSFDISKYYKYNDLLLKVSSIP